MSWITRNCLLRYRGAEPVTRGASRASRHQQTLREEEQKRIARDIHDELGQMLTGLKLDIHLMRKKMDVVSGNGISAALDDLSLHVDSTIGSVRRIASEIRPSILDDFGLIAALEWQAGDFERKAGIECSFASAIEGVDIDPEAGAAVFRIVQEALTNVARHADATKVEVTVSTVDDELCLNIKDNGRGIDLDRLSKKRTLGIIGMRERARLIGAILQIRGRSIGGTAVELAVPIVRQERRPPRYDQCRHCRRSRDRSSRFARSLTQRATSARSPRHLRVRKCWTYVREDHVDVVVLDITMPGRNGLEILKGTAKVVSASPP